MTNFKTNPPAVGSPSLGVIKAHVGSPSLGVKEEEQKDPAAPSLTTKEEKKPK